MKKLLLFALLLLPILAIAQEQAYSIEIDAKSLTPVQTDQLSGVPIDKIGLDRSMRPCARIKMRINRMTREEISQLSVMAVGGVVEVMRQIVAREGNGFIIELTAKPETRFYLKHPKYGDSNEVSLALEGDKEYRINAQLNYLHTIVVSSNVVGAEIYLNDEFKGITGSDYTLTINDVIPGQHKIRVQDGSLKSEKSVEVSGSHISFRVEIDQEQARPQFVVFDIKPRNATIVIDDKDYSLDQYGQKTLVLQNGSHSYTVSANNYHDEKGVLVVDGKKVEKSISLRPAFGWLEVSGEGALNGASVYVGGNLIGKAPLKSDILASGVYDIRIVKNMYKTHEGKVVIQDNQTTNYTPELSADFATVTLHAAEGCEIYINNEYNGETSWSGNLATGTYIFEARKTNHHTTSLSKNISPNPALQSYTLSAPKPILGALKILSSPALADVYIDDVLVGRTPMIHDLIIGNHSISVRKEGFEALHQPVTITEGQTAELNLTLTMEEGYTIDDMPSTTVAQSAPTTTSENNVSHSNAISKRRTAYREHQKGFESVADISLNFWSNYYAPSLELTYTAGYRFNNYLYLGAGAGLSYNFWGEPSERTTTSGGDYHNYYYGPYLTPCAVSVPIFAYFRANFINRRFSPFFALQVGGKFSGKQTLILDVGNVEYNTSAFFATPQLGFNFRTSTTTSVFVACGFPLYVAPYCNEFTSYNATITRELDYGIDVRLGITF